MTANIYGAVDKLSLTGGTMTGPLDGTSIVTGVVVLTYAATINLNVSDGGHFRCTLTGNATIASPSDPADGQKITLELIQDATGGRTVSWGAAFDFGTTGAPTPTATASKRDLIGFVYSASASAWLFAGIMQGF
jgi:hypothetical protein